MEKFSSLSTSEDYQIVMSTEKKSNVNYSPANLDFDVTPTSIKLTAKTKEMLDYISNHMQISKSNAIRMCIASYYNNLKHEGEYNG